MWSIEETIIQRLGSGPCCFEEVVTYLSNLSWGKKFVAVARMARDGRLLLRQLAYSAYDISVSSQFASTSSGSSQMGQTTWNVMPMLHAAALRVKQQP